MASIISWQFIAWPLSPRTRAAASSALSFFGCAAAAGDFASFAAAAFLVEVFVFFLPAMMRLLRKVMESRRHPTRRPNRQDSYLHRLGQLKRIPSRSEAFFSAGIRGWNRHGRRETAVEHRMAKPSVRGPFLKAYPAIKLRFDPARGFGTGYYRVCAPSGRELLHPAC